MKKELLIASALATTLGVASVAEAATASFSGNVRNGVSGSDSDGTADGTFGSDQKASLSFSVSETTDGGIKISTGFNVQDEGTNDLGDANGLTLTFTDGSKLDVIEAGNAFATHLASVPGASGEQGLTGLTTNSAPTALTFGDTSDQVGFEWHSAADAFGVEGMKVGFSLANGDDGDTSNTSTAETSYSVGISYTTTAGDTSVTVGGGFINADDSNTTTSNDRADATAIAGTATTGNLTVGVGFASGSYIAARSGTSEEVDSAEVVTAGVKYVSGDITFAVGMVDGEGSDGSIGSNGSNTDTYESLSGSVDYVVASGVTATIGYSDESAQDENASLSANSGNSWYIGANVSF
jgi:hypothetical protein